MNYAQYGNTYVVSIAPGEEIVDSLKRACEAERITLGSISGIGAAKQIELGYYNVSDKQYETTTLADEHEITALVGNVTTMDDDIYLHIHITVGDRSFSAHAGHLVSATVSGACEVFIHTEAGSVGRYADEDETGLHLLDL